jgi:hypothetical protein
MVEFLIVAPALALLIFGIFQFALIYRAKITLNYAAFETARAGSLNHARMWAMELAFARALAPLYTTPFTEPTSDPDEPCDVDFSLGTRPGSEVSLDLDNVLCARQRVKDLLEARYARILLVNPSEESFASSHAVTEGGTTYIPSDNLMYRSAVPDGLSNQSIQDANLIKVHVALCYRLIVPIVGPLITRMIALAPDEEYPWYFGAPDSTSFAHTCTVERPAHASERPDGMSRDGIPLFAQAVIRMQSDPILDRFCAGDCGTP